MFERTITGVGLGLIMACQSATVAPAPPPAMPTASHGVEQFFPLKDGIVYAYDTSSSSGDKGMLALEIRRTRSGAVELIVAGRTRRLELDDTGLRHATGGWLLKLPLTEGATYPGDFGQVKVTSVDRKISVPLGNFAGCLETVEAVSNDQLSKRTTTVFCPGVGIVQRQTDAETDTEAGSETLVLRSFGPRVQDL
ncbi:MAG TPA: hypothetical protein VFQ61_22550 [Polyangiaceae bacterium]|nr:hypothetical protein [Polyangiaceae bacterium]